MSFLCLACQFGWANNAWATGVSFIHQDHLGSASLVTDSEGNNPEKRTYYPFGAIEKESVIGHEPNAYNDKELDPKTKLYNFEARMYAGQKMHFTTPDTIVPDETDPQSWNRYAYVLNNPMKYVDPTGHSPVLNGDIAGWVGDYLPQLKQHGPVLYDAYLDVGYITNHPSEAGAWKEATDGNFAGMYYPKGEGTEFFPSTFADKARIIIREHVVNFRWFNLSEDKSTWPGDLRSRNVEESFAILVHELGHHVQPKKFLNYYSDEATPEVLSAEFEFEVWKADFLHFRTDKVGISSMRATFAIEGLSDLVAAAQKEQQKNGFVTFSFPNEGPTFQHPVSDASFDFAFQTLNELTNRMQRLEGMKPHEKFETLSTGETIEYRWYSAP